jgi:membrane-associated phospholipid phosphatase
MRRRLLLAAGLCALAAAAVWAAAFHLAGVQTADVWLLGRLYGLGGQSGNQVAHGFATCFDPVPYAVLGLTLIAGAMALRRRPEALAAAVLLAGSSVTTQLLKPALGEQRPFPPGLYLPPASWPSGHTTAVVSLALALVIVAPPARRRLAAVAGGLVSAGTGFALLVCGSHYPSDIAGGACVAAGWACLVAAALPRRSAGAARHPQRLRAPRSDVEAA